MAMPIFILSLLILSLPPPSLSLSSSSDFDYLHVHDLIASTQHQHLHHSTTSTNFTLPLLHRDAISGHPHSIAHLLKRDSVRVSALTLYLTTTTTTPNAAPSYHLDDFSSDVVSGLDEGSGEYFVRIGVGSPPHQQYMVIDSGSDIVWVQCQPCSQCYSQADPVFDPAYSASFAGISCGSPICGLLASSAGCRSGRCR